MNLTIFDAVQETSPETLVIDPRSLYHAFEQVRDGRKERGKRYPLPLIFTLVLLGKLAGETTISGIVDWVKWRAGWLRTQLDWPKRFPSQATYTRALACCDAEALAQVMAQVLLKARADAPAGQEPEDGSGEQALPPFPEGSQSMAKPCAEPSSIKASSSLRSMCSPGTNRPRASCWLIEPWSTNAMRSVRCCPG